MNRVTIRRFDVIRTANIAAALYAVAVIVFALVFFVPFMLLAGIAGREYVGGGMASVFGAGIAGALVLAIVGAIFYAIVGWIMTAIVVVLYNFVAGRIGGLQLDVTIEGPGPGPGPGGPGYGYPATGYAVPPGYQPGYPAAPTPYPGYGGGQPPQPPAGWGPPQG